MYSDLPTVTLLTWCIKVYDEVVENPYEESGGDDEEALTGVRNIHFPAMRTWIKEHLEAASEKVGGAAEHIYFLCRVMLISPRVCFHAREWLLRTRMTTTSWQRCWRFLLS